MPPNNDVKSASMGLSSNAMTGVIIIFSAKKLEAPMKTLIGTKLKIA